MSQHQSDQAWCRLVRQEVAQQAREHRPVIDVQAMTLTADGVLTIDYLDPWLPARRLRLRRALSAYQLEDGPWWPGGRAQSGTQPPAEAVAQAIVEGDLGEPLGTVSPRAQPDGALLWGN